MVGALLGTLTRVSARLACILRFLDGNVEMDGNGGNPVHPLTLAVHSTFFNGDGGDSGDAGISPVHPRDSHHEYLLVF